MKSLRAAQHGAERGAEALGEVEPDGIEAGDHLGRRDGGGDAGVHQPGAVHVRAPALLARHRDDGVELFERPDGAAADIGGLLHLQEALRRGVAGARADRGAHVLGGEDAARAAERQDLHAGEGGVRAALRVEDVARLVRQHLVAAPAMGEDRRHVAHGAGGQEHRRLLAHERGHAVAEGVDGRVVAVLLVADLGAHHGVLHRRGRAGLGVGVEVDPHRRRVREAGGAGRGPCGRGSSMRRRSARMVAADPLGATPRNASSQRGPAPGRIAPRFGGGGRCLRCGRS